MDLEKGHSVNYDSTETIPLVDEAKKSPPSQLRLIFICMWTFGVQFGFNAEFVLGTPLFKSLGMSSFLTSFAWLAGPVSGLIFQPIIGAISDRYTGRFGRRRPFIFVGAIIAVIGLILFANPQWLAELMDQPDNLTIQIWFSITSLWILNIGLNIMQGPAWALVLDLCGSNPEVQKRGNATVAALSALSGILTNLLGFVDLVKFFPFFADNAHALFYIGVIVVISSLIPTLLAANETVYDPKDHPDNQSHGFFKELHVVFTGMNNPTLRLVLVMFFAFGSFSPYQFYFTDFFGEEVYGGDAEASGDLYEDYQQGVRMGSLGFALMQTVSFLYSFVLPPLLNRLGVKPMFAFGLIVGGLCFILPTIPPLVAPIPAEIIFAFCGILSSTNNIIPYSVVGEVASSDAGRYIGLLNVTQVTAQMFANFAASAVMTLTDSLTFGIAAGGVLALVAFAGVWFLRLPLPPISKKTNI